MTQNIDSILVALQETPRILKELLSEINPKFYKERLIKDKWTIHENAIHIATLDTYGFQSRLKQFKLENRPKITPLSGDDFEKDFLLKLDLKNSVDQFFKIRQHTLTLAQELTSSDWTKTAIHPEYAIYTPYIMLRHLLMHDHSHLYKIEDMGFSIGHIR